ncbi:MAG: molybdate ABC transporter substrate-binding protein [Chloroflexota bacterium]|nr:molybdate ABC transporter substrate-binding protein [Chloroflexota bacterium]
MPRFARLIVPIALFLVLLVAACGGSATSAPAATITATKAPTAASTIAPTGIVAASSATTGTVAASGTLTVFAAASLTESFTEIKSVFEKAHPGVTVQYNFGGSPTLVTQLTQGAPADVFASADQPNMDNAIKGGVIAGTPQTFVKNKLVIIVPKENKAGIKTPKDLAKPGIKFDTAQASVPVDKYTQQALDNFSKLPDYGADFTTKVNTNTVSQEDNVKAIVQKVQLGEADAGIVYATDAQAAKDKLTLIQIPDAQNVIATYPIALVKDAKQAALGQQFVNYLLAPNGQAILQKYGFAPGM